MKLLEKTRIAFYLNSVHCKLKTVALQKKRLRLNRGTLYTLKS